MLPGRALQMKPNAGGGGGTWQTARTAFTANSDSTGWNGWTAREVVLASSLSDISGSKIRVSFKSSPTTQLKIAKAFVGIKTGTLDYTTTPTPILFSGGAAITIPSNTVQVSDEVIFAYDGTVDLVFGMYHDATAGYAGATTTARSTLYQKNADNAATVSVSGFGTGTTHDIIWLVEVFA